MQVEFALFFKFFLNSERVRSKQAAARFSPSISKNADLVRTGEATRHRGGI
jgi:hypothetical protein